MDLYIEMANKSRYKQTRNMEYEQAWSQAGWILANFVFILRVYGKGTVNVHVQATN